MSLAYYRGLRREDGFRRELEKLPRVSTQRVDMRRAPRPSDLAAELKICRYIKAAEPVDVINGHSPKTVPWRACREIGNAFTIEAMTEKTSVFITP